MTEEIINTIKKAKLSGNLLSGTDILEILKVTRSVTANKEMIDSLIFFHSIYVPKKTLTKLTKRENQIMKMIGYCKSTNEIAKELNLSSSTIETHRKNIRKKLSISGNGKLIYYAILNALTEKP